MILNVAGVRARECVHREHSFVSLTMPGCMYESAHGKHITFKQHNQSNDFDLFRSDVCVCVFLVHATTVLAVFDSLDIEKEGEQEKKTKALQCRRTEHRKSKSGSV